MAVFKKRDKIHYQINGQKNIYTDDEEKLIVAKKTEDIIYDIQHSSSLYYYNYKIQQFCFLDNVTGEFNDIDISDIIKKSKEIKKSLKYYYDEKIYTNKDGSKRTVKKKKKELKKIINNSYPKEYYDPSDVEYDKDGKDFYFFNVSKTLRKYNIMFLLKIIPINVLNNLTNKKIFHKWATKQHYKVEKLNNSPVKEQKKYDRMCIKINYAIKGFISSVISFLLLFIIIPSFVYSSAYYDFSTGNYESAYNKFKYIPLYDNAYYMGKYCNAKVYLNNGDFDKSAKLFEELKENSSKLSSVISLDDIENETLYQKALELYSNKDYANAKDIFKTIYKYKESTQYYYKCTYQIANTYYEENDLDNALLNFYAAKEYDDALDRFNNIASQYYKKGLELYDSNKYLEASEYFNILSTYKYENAENYYKNCIYQDALLSFKNKKYSESEEKFSKLESFKDSNLLKKESIYKSAVNLIDADPAQSSILLSKIPYFRDQQNLILKPSVVLFGDWEITEINNQPVKDYSFSFTSDMQILSDDTLVAMAVSNDISAYPYKWDDNQYIAGDGKYSISIKVKDAENITITSSDKNQSATYECKKTANLKIGNGNQEKELSVKEIIQNYVNKKLDKKIVIDNKTINIETIKGQIINNDNNNIKELQKGIEKETSDELKDEQENDSNNKKE